jgi:hypothetical protein
MATLSVRLNRSRSMTASYRMTTGARFTPAITDE